MRSLITLSIVILLLSPSYLIVTSNNSFIENTINDSEVNINSLSEDYIIVDASKNRFETSVKTLPPIITESNELTEIKYYEQTSKTLTPNKPMLPVITRVFILPFKTIIKDFNVIFYENIVKKLVYPIKLAPEISTIGDDYLINENLIQEKNEDTQNPIIYPENLYEYHINSGRYYNEIVNYLTIRIFPVKYDLINSMITYGNKFDISFNYKIPDKPTNFGNEYDLVIVTPISFLKEIKPLVEHKNSHGIRTKLVAIEEILLGLKYPIQGRDNAEKLKYFIKFSLDEWGIKYVLLFGGRRGGILNQLWWIPARYSNIVDFIERSYLSDLYFADIYDSEGNFSSWDSNNDNVFGEWYTGTKDIIDMYPDVFVGRIPCKNKDEARTMVKKITDYENMVFGEDWLKRFVGVAGDSYPNLGESYYEGELATEAAFNFLVNFESTFLWTSTGNFTDKNNVIDEVNKGCGFLMFSGHGNPKDWATHPPENESWIVVTNTFEMQEFNNTNKLPIVLVTGCWNSKFSTSLFEIVSGVLREGFSFFVKTKPASGYYLYEWVPKCWSWSFCSLPDKGCIAIMGNTGLGYGIHGEECLSGKSQFMEIQFFKSFSEGRDILGDVHSNQIIHYMNEFPPMENKIDCKIPQQWTLIGDPSLKIGGYPLN
jgi:hypothetical protein